MKKETKKRNIIISIVLLLLILIIVLLWLFRTKPVTVDWNIKVTGENTLDIQITNIESSDDEKLVWQEGSANINTTLAKLEDSVEYEITLENKGEKTAVLDDFEISKLDSEIITVKTKGLEEDSVLKADEETTFTVIITYNKRVRKETTVDDLTLKLDYVESGKKDNSSTSTKKDQPSIATVDNDKSQNEVEDKIFLVITGVENNAYYKTNVTASINNTGVKVTLDGKPYIPGSKITEEGEHTLVITDEDGQKVIINFTIDKTKAEITGIEDGAYYNKNVIAAITDKSEIKALLNEKDYISGTEISEEGKYTLVVTDKAGNETIISFTIDKTKPEVEGIENGVYYNEDVTATIVDATEVTALLDGKPYKSETKITKEGEHTLTVIDKAGNEIEPITFVIDKTAPEITGVEDGAYYNEDVIATITDKYEVTVTLNGEEYTSGTEITEEGEYTLVATDKAGNETEVSFIIDKTAPIVTGVEEGSYYNTDVTATITDKYEVTSTLNGEEYISGTEITEEGEYTLVATDKAGNETTVSFVIDKTAPVVTGVENESYYNEDVTAIITDKYEVISTLNGDKYISGTKITEEGEYTIVATDQAGNETIVSFVIDKTAPSITGVEDGAYYNEDVIAIITDKYEVTATLNSKEYVSGTEITEEGEYTLVATDKAGNETIVSFIIDKTAPSITGVESESYNNKDITITIKDATKVTATLNGEEYISGTKVTEEGEYTLTAIDQAGNIMEPITFVIDKTGPTITIDENVVLKHGEGFVEDIYENISDEYTDLEYLKSHTVIDGTVDHTVKDSYTITYTVTDQAGNSTTKVRTIVVSPYAMFVDGSTFNQRVKNYASKNYVNIVTIEQAETEPTTKDYIELQASGSNTPIKMWVEGSVQGTKEELVDAKLLWYTEDEKPRLNSNSSNMFLDFSKLKKQDITTVVDTSQVTSMFGMFRNCSELTELDISNFDTNKVTNMSYMFFGCSNLTALDLSNFETNKVTSMSYMFYNCTNLTTLDVNNFDTSNVTAMDWMFYSCKKLTTLNVSGFNTSKVTNMYSMFGFCSSLTNLDVSNFDTSSVTNMTYMFYGCSKLTTLDVSNFNTSKVTTMFGTFRSCSALTELDLSNFDTSNVTNMSYMFNNSSKLLTLDLSNFDTSKVTSMNNMFSYCTSLASLNISNFNTSQVVDMGQMFYNCSSLTDLDLSSFDTSQVTNMGQMFYKCSKLTTLDVSNFDTSKVTDMGTMFRDCTSLTELNLINFDTSKVRSMSNMFENCNKLTMLDVSSFNTSKVTTMFNMFYNCSSLTTLDVTGFSTSSVTNMQSMFYNCKKLISLDLSNFNTSSVTNMSNMFYYCSSLTSLDLTNFDTSQVTKMSSMFSGCSSLTSLDLTNFDTSQVTIMSSMFNGCKNLTTLDISNFITSNVTTMAAMFYNCSNLTNLDVSHFDTSKVTSMNSMFSGCSSLTNLDVSNFDTSKVTNMGVMFAGCSSLTNLDISNFDTSQVTNMGQMFYNCSKLTTLDVSNFDTSKVTDMGTMFRDCTSLTELDLTNFDTSQVISMSNMFENCNKLTIVDLSNFDTSQVTTMFNMFNNCNNLEILDISNFDTSKVTNMSQMFNNCSKLVTIYASDEFITDNVSTSSSMFSACRKLIGGNGTVFSTSHTNAEYARIDMESTPGYFTSKEDTLDVLELVPNTFVMKKSTMSETINDLKIVEEFVIQEDIGLTQQTDALDDIKQSEITSLTDLEITEQPQVDEVEITSLDELEEIPETIEETNETEDIIVFEEINED